MKKTLILVIDGCAPEYLTPETAPNIHALASAFGFVKRVKGAVPTVTNVNHACILSGRFPEETKMTGNYFYNPETGEEGFIEEKGIMKAETILQRCRSLGGKTAFLTVKGKLLGIYGEDADLGISVQNPDETLLSSLGLGMPPKVSDLSSTRWILEAALACIQKESPELVYCTTNDFCFHHYGPDTEEAREQIAWIDQYVKAIHEAEPDRQIYITADHGMNQKHHLINFQHIADNRGLHLFCLAPLKDRYIENHIYQEGGVLYLFLKRPEERKALLELVNSTPEIERILTKEEAASLLHLPPEKIGDYVLLAAPDCAFGEVDGESLYTDDVRTHGSIHEQEVPLAAIHPHMPASAYQYSKDIAVYLLSETESA